MGTGASILEVKLDPADRLEPAVRRVAEAVRHARASGQRALLVVVPPDWGVVPSAAERVAMVRHWAQAAEGRVRLAVVAPPGLFDDERLGVVAARGFGLLGEVFEHEGEARAWLEQPA